MFYFDQTQEYAPDLGPMKLHSRTATIGDDPKYLVCHEVYARWPGGEFQLSILGKSWLLLLGTT